MPIDTRSISAILQAFNQGFQERQEREALGFAQKKHSEELELKEKERQDAVKRFEQQAKIAQDREDRLRKVEESQREYQIFNTKRLIADMLAKGQIPSNTKPIEGSNLLSGFAMDKVLPVMKGPVEFAGQTMSPTEYSTPAESYADSPVVRLQMQRQKDQQAFQEAQRIAGQTFTAGENQKDRELRRDISEWDRDTQIQVNQARINAAAARSEMQATRRTEQDKVKSRDKAISIISNFTKHPLQKTFGELATDTALAKNYLNDPKAMRGINDVQLAYMFVRSQDPNAVKGDEMRLLRDNANSWLDSLGIKGYNLFANEKSMFSDEARRKMASLIIAKNTSRFRQYQDFRDSNVSILQDVYPEYVDKLPNALKPLEPGPLKIKVDSKTFDEVTRGK